MVAPKIKQAHYRIVVNGEDVTDTIKPLFISMQVTDNDKEQADELTLTMSKKFVRPVYNDSIKVYLGYGDKLEFVGLFFVQKTTIRDNRELTISATSTDFNVALKERRHVNYDDITLGALTTKIAQRHGLNVRTDLFDNAAKFEQINESDLHFLNKLATAHNAVFNIKNSTLYFMKKGSVDVPVIAIDINRCSSSEITHSNKTLYKSCKAVWQDTKLNKTAYITAGEGKPELVKQGHFQSYNEALDVAKNALIRANKGLAEGSLSTAGQVIFAGSKLTLDNEEYEISTVRHSVTNTGWTTSLDFKNFEENSK